MQIGIVGLPNVGKSTLFNALTRSSSAAAANYPFCTIDPNTGVVEVPDERLQAIASIVQPQKIIPAIMGFTDIAGLVKGASEGEGLGNQFLAHIRECDAIAQVVRLFKNDNIIHVHDTVDPKRDIEIIETELILADLETLKKRISATERELKTGKAEIKEKLAFFQKLQSFMEEGKRARLFSFTVEEQEFVKECHLLTVKPILYIANVAEDDLISFDAAKTRLFLGLEQDAVIVPISVKLEEDLNDMSIEEGKAFLQEMGIPDSGRAELIREAYKTLGLETYFTAGEKEVRAWTFKKGSKAPVCAGIIHSDFEKTFICSDTIFWSDFVSAGGWASGKERGLVRMEGREYLMKDGDVCVFKCGK